MDEGMDGVYVLCVAFLSLRSVLVLRDNGNWDHIFFWIYLRFWRRKD